MVQFFERAGQFLAFFLSFLLSFRPPIFISELLNQLLRFSKISLLPTILTVCPFALVTAFHGYAALSMFGAERVLPSATILVVMREIGPVAAAIIMAAQYGNIISSEIALMKIRGEVDVLKVMGVDPFRFIITPRILSAVFGAIISFQIALVLSVFTTAVYMIKIKGMAEGVFFADIWTFISPMDLIGGLAKAGSFGFAIALISCFFGYSTEGGSEEVGKSSSFSIVVSSLAFITLNFFLTAAFFGNITPELR